jgi:hypothetical protein
MTNEQFDLFDDVSSPATSAPPQPAAPRPLDPTGLGDEELLERLDDRPMAECLERVREIKRRRLTAACSPLETLCLRHAGFGRTRIVPEQAAAIEALVAIGGGEAAASISRLITRRIVEGPALGLAFSAAVLLGSSLPEEIVGEHLRNDDPEIRCLAARCVRAWPRLAPNLIELLDDLRSEVQIAAACALGRMGRSEARALLVRSLQETPTEEIVDASARIGDRETIVLLGRLAASRPDLSAVAIEALKSIDHPMADRVLLGLHPKHTGG